MQRFIRNQKGQLAIFIALTFQVLFVFFAMVVNVGLLVHHKINLQNSVDLAAYYGAMKQAEMLGAIGHVNYQIRQSWKLLSWRNRVLGSMGYIGYSSDPNPKVPHPVHRQLAEEDVPWKKQNGDTVIPVFCATFTPLWMNGNPSENACRGYLEKVSIPAIPTPSVIAGFIGFNQSIKKFSANMGKVAFQGCRAYGSNNWWMAAGMLYGYLQDSFNRKQTIYALANALSRDINDFRDIEDNSVRMGVIRTLRKNLTLPNRSSFNADSDEVSDTGTGFRFYNSLAAEGCGGGSNEQPPGWLSDIQIRPTMLYADFTCTIDGAQSPDDPKPVSVEPNYFSNYRSELDADGSILDTVQAAANGSLDPFRRPTLGVEKNPWCMAYVAVEATTRPEIPFSPFGPITLKAKAYAKPFGGKIGPWYNSLWPSGSNQSNSGKKVDQLWPTREGADAGVPDEEDYSRLPNASRYVGDEIGFSSHLNIINQGGPLFDASSPASISQAKKIHFHHYIQNVEPIDDGASDLLAYDNREDGGDWEFLRRMEMAVIAPDMFDVAYYSIDPDYFKNYYQRLSSGMEKASSGNFTFRPDLGARLGEDDSAMGIGVREHIGFAAGGEFFNTTNRLSYYMRNSTQLLTNWVDVDLADYSFGRVLAAGKFFGDCIQPTTDGPPIPGSCIAGGRNGYSIKLVSKDHLLQSDLPLGGEGTSGEIRNKPPW